MSRTFTFSVQMSSEEVRNIMYNSPIKRLSLMTFEGLRLELPISHFQKFVGYNGIQGVFRLVLNDDNSFVSLERIR
ncbi:MAG: DUF2835 family protein [Succinivibrionaceae bacterium]|nr:DUF2835 family protein [Succinivibrionaceae bacterium]